MLTVYANQVAHTKHYVLTLFKLYCYKIKPHCLNCALNLNESYENFKLINNDFKRPLKILSVIRFLSSRKNLASFFQQLFWFVVDSGFWLMPFAAKTAKAVLIVSVEGNWSRVRIHAISTKKEGGYVEILPQGLSYVFAFVFANVNWIFLCWYSSKQQNRKCSRCPKPSKVRPSEQLCKCQ
jgi:hypothetical protein